MDLQVLELALALSGITRGLTILAETLPAKTPLHINCLLQFNRMANVAGSQMRDYVRCDEKESLAWRPNVRSTV
jgi:hypothetical protein